MIKIKRSSPFWSLHTHSRFSVNDALSDVKQIVARASEMRQPALGLTDHGNIAGSVQLYKECAKRGIMPFPGSELYVVADRNSSTATKRFHMLVNAYSTEGYKNLVALSTKTYKDFYYKPIVGLPDFAQMHEAGLLKGLSATSGCFYGMVSQYLVAGDTAAAKGLLTQMAKWFEGAFYVEIQNHWIENELPDTTRSLMLYDLAGELGLPVVITQDSHYCHPEQKPAHETLKRLVAWGDDPDDAVFPGDGFHMADDAWMRDHHPDNIYEAGIEGLQDLKSKHDLSIPQLDHYSYNIPFTVDDPNYALKDRCWERLYALRDANKNRYGTKYWDRLKSELEIIEATGMAGYLILVAECTDWLKANRVFYQARGSASGSIVCWLLGITQADPIKWGLIFERFISRDRTKPPDVDLDIEHVRRKDFVEWLRGRFVVNQIGTWLEYFLNDQDEDDAKGSLRVKYYSAQGRRGISYDSWSEVPDEDKRALQELSRIKEGPNKRPGAFYAYGTHPAGMVLTTTHDEFDSIVPTMLIASSKTLVTQYAMKDIEDLGLVKLDVLGLKTLTVLHRCMDFMGRDVFDGLDWIPLNDGPTFRAIARGDTDGVFQLEGGSARRGVKELKPSKISDVIAAMALFRPATMSSGATDAYIARKHKQLDTPTRHRIIEEHVNRTNGIMLFQEQVIAILRDLGMNPDDLTAFLKAVKASNENIGGAGQVIESYQAKVFDLAGQAEMSSNDLDWLWEAIEGFAQYGFNQAHSTAYGLTAYYCAYLSVHHPTEFHAALLSVAAGDKDKEPKYLRATRSRGIRVLSPSINQSELSYVPQESWVRKGLLSVKGIGEKTAEELITKRPPGGYESLEHLCTLVDRRKVTGTRPFLEKGETDVGAISKLMTAEVLDEIPLRTPGDAEDADSGTSSHPSPETVK